jgi:hypothetical protein
MLSPVVAATDSGRRRVDVAALTEVQLRGLQLSSRGKGTTAKGVQSVSFDSRRTRNLTYLPGLAHPSNSHEPLDLAACILSKPGDALVPNELPLVDAAVLLLKRD